jgi:hypothetical protein
MCAHSVCVRVVLSAVQCSEAVNRLFSHDGSGPWRSVKRPYFFKSFIKRLLASAITARFVRVRVRACVRACVRVRARAQVGSTLLSRCASRCTVPVPLCSTTTDTLTVCDGSPDVGTYVQQISAGYGRTTQTLRWTRVGWPPTPLPRFNVSYKWAEHSRTQEEGLRERSPSILHCLQLAIVL